MQSWGVELWDQFDPIIALNKKETANLESVYAKFMKERGEIEKEYSRSLKRLVNNYLPKENKKGQDKITDDEESTQCKSFRLILKETVYQANQHESLADVFAKEIYNSIKKKCKEFTETAKEYAEEKKKHDNEKAKSDMQLERVKVKYQRSFFDLEQAQMDYNKADASNDVSRNQIQKLAKTTDSRKMYCDKMKGDYAHELMRANETQRQYYYQYLPAVFNNLQALQISRGTFVKDTFTRSVAAEQEAVPIVVKCLEEMDRFVKEIDPSEDTHLVIQRYKTGNMPPGDIPFEELMPGDTGDKYKTLQKKSKGSQPQENLYPRKRELEKKISVMEEEINKGQREITGLRKVLETYNQNPNFGDKNAKLKAAKELEIATLKVQNMESELHTLKTDLITTDNKLEAMRNRNNGDTPKSGRRSPSLSDRGSVGYGTISNSSNSSEQDTDSLGEKRMAAPETNSNWDDDINSDGGSSGSEASSFPPPPENFGVARALYDFLGEEEANLSMRAGDEFHVTEMDMDGWTKVLRMDMTLEGYVPTSFLEFLQ